jgi:hypothetical protein
MELFGFFLSWQSIAVTVVVYCLTLAFYRLYLHPLAKFPGPKLAAITRYYEAYYDIVQNGQYTFRIAEMHKKYGKEPLPPPELRQFACSVNSSIADTRGTANLKVPLSA